MKDGSFIYLTILGGTTGYIFLTVVERTMGGTWTIIAGIAFFLSGMLFANELKNLKKEIKGLRNSKD